MDSFTPDYSVEAPPENDASLLRDVGASEAAPGVAAEVTGAEQQRPRRKTRAEMTPEEKAKSNRERKQRAKESALRAHAAKAKGSAAVPDMRPPPGLPLDGSNDLASQVPDMRPPSGLSPVGVNELASQVPEMMPAMTLTMPPGHAGGTASQVGLATSSADSEILASESRLKRKLPRALMTPEEKAVLNKARRLRYLRATATKKETEQAPQGSASSSAAVGGSSSSSQPAVAFPATSLPATVGLGDRSGPASRLSPGFGSCGASGCGFRSCGGGCGPAGCAGGSGCGSAAGCSGFGGSGCGSAGGCSSLGLATMRTADSAKHPKKPRSMMTREEKTLENKKRKLREEKKKAFPSNSASRRITELLTSRCRCGRLVRTARRSHF
eukprot:TRINITY_DN24680_c0_g1_i1.p1 TRINITY_DN24680_c0_g1~~TRINITY_DN24680_c0_g1_i1.p1  ORF type:complete len:394 (+),score=80.76 TRINITY_DN24680_c0_g1_i1:35-1183(+)